MSEKSVTIKAEADKAVKDIRRTTLAATSKPKLPLNAAGSARII